MNLSIAARNLLTQIHSNRVGTLVVEFDGCKGEAKLNGEPVDTASVAELLDAKMISYNSVDREDNTLYMTELGHEESHKLEEVNI